MSLKVHRWEFQIYLRQASFALSLLGLKKGGWKAYGNDRSTCERHGAPQMLPSPLSLDHCPPSSQEVYFHFFSVKDRGLGKDRT
jgi:hypothetical protein